MKEFYESPELELVVFSADDIITTSIKEDVTTGSDTEKTGKN